MTAEIEALDAALHAVIAADADLSPESFICSALSAAAHAAGRAGFRTAVEEALETIGSQFEEDMSDRALVVQSLLFDVNQQRMDEPLLSHRARGLSVARAAVTKGRFHAVLPDVEGYATAAGALLPSLAREDDSSSLVVLGVIQLFVNGDLADFKGVQAELPEENRDVADPRLLDSAVAAEYLAGAINRLLWGRGVIAFTPNRILGFVFSDVIDRLDDSNARIVLPRAYLDEVDGSGSVVSFSLSKSHVTIAEADMGFLGGKLPWITVEGDDFALTCIPGLVDAAGASW